MSSGRGGRGGSVRGQPIPTGARPRAPGTPGTTGTGTARGGRGAGRRPPRQPPTPAQLLELEYGVVATKPSTLTQKQGSSGVSLPLVANFFKLEKREEWCLYHYRVDFKPEESLTSIKKLILRPHCAQFGLCIFDGHSLYTPNRLRPDPMVIHAIRPTDGRTHVQINIRLVGQVNQTDYMTLQFYNIVVRKCMESLKLEEMGRHFFDKSAAIVLPELRLELWPGYITSIRNHEKDVLLCVEPIHKVLRMDSVLSVINKMKSMSKSTSGYQHGVAKDVVGGIVMTMYNRKTYRIDDIKWDMTPKSTFNVTVQLKNGAKEEKQVSYLEYYRDRYAQDITNLDQPLLVSLPRRQDHHRGNSGPILLIPELCQMTGLTDKMRVDYKLMATLSGHMHLSPTTRAQKTMDFMSRLQRLPEIRKELEDWGLKFSKDIMDVPGRVLPKEKVYFAPKMEGATLKLSSDFPDENGEWTKFLKEKKMKQCCSMTCWVLLIPVEHADYANQLVTSIRTSAKQMGFNVATPVSIVKITDKGHSPAAYVTAIDEAYTKWGKKLEMILTVLPNSKLEIYSAIKKRCFIDYGISSQCFLSKHFTSKSANNFDSIISKLVIQLNTKLGGIPWEIENPLGTAMVIGFDVYHCANRRGLSVGALVASTSPNVGKYFSTVSFHKDKNELSSNLCGDITKALQHYASNNKGNLPKRVIMYRDGVGEGQLAYVYHTELTQVKNALALAYGDREKPKFTFIVTTKKINTRLFADPLKAEKKNPPPGTVVDDVITLPERHDFLLVSSNCRQGTVAPTAYNILYDEQGLSADQLQRFTYKLCHLYYNSSSTVGVPAPCQYAHKLAYITGLSLSQKCNEALADRLYYL